MPNTPINICFVCYGNICRSPMAVAIMSDIIEKDPVLSKRNIEICSAGTGAIRGQAAHPYAQDTMKEWGLTLDDHVSSPLYPDIVDRADIIVAIDNHVNRDIVYSFPASSEKICALNIADPYSYLMDAYRRCAQLIKDDCISKVLPLVNSLCRPD